MIEAEHDVTYFFRFWTNDNNYFHPNEEFLNV